MKSALISMPFFSTKRPSIQLGLLHSIAEEKGFAIESFSYNLSFAKLIGISLYEKLCQHRGKLIGDWLFSVVAFAEEAPDKDCEFLKVIFEELPFLLESKTEDVYFYIEKLIEIREIIIPKFIQEIASQKIWESFATVGFSSTFQQTTASIALARFLKKFHPKLITIFGGANFDGEMGAELLRGVECIDFIAIGEADRSYPLFLECVKNNIEPTSLKGIYSKEEVRTKPIIGDSIPDLSDLPVPNYDEFFERSVHLGLVSREDSKNVDIPFESSRGCWWGQKHHCVFCGLNGSTMNYRKKSPEKVLAELNKQTQKYRSFRFEAVDNIIDMGYLNTFFPLLIENNFTYDFFYETKANLTKDQIKLLSESGVRRIQPGIESFSPNVLQIMKKGVKAIHNIFLLKWCLHYGIHVMWNLIWGFPGEKESDYLNQKKILENISHLEPPVGGFRIWLERFSPLFFDNINYKKEFVSPEISYQYIYPARLQINEIAYFFDYRFQNELKDESFTEFEMLINGWRQSWQEAKPRPTLHIKSSKNYIEILENRNNKIKGEYEFSYELADIYQFCTLNYHLRERIKKEFQNIPSTFVDEILEEFCCKGLMINIDGYFLSIATPYTHGSKL